MADNVQLNIPDSAGATIATDDISGVQHQLIKVEYGVDGVATPVSASDPLPVVDSAGNVSLASIDSKITAVNTGAVVVSTSVLPTGAATAANQQTNALTDAQLRATPVPVSGTVTTGGLTDAQLRAVAVPVSGSFFQATQPVSATDLDVRNLVFATDKVDASGTVLGAGANNIGDVDVASIAAGDNNIGNVDIVTMPNVVIGSGTITAVTAITNALPAGTNNIGDVDVLTLPAIPAGNNNIGDVDIASIAAGTNYIGKVRLTDGTTDADIRDLTNSNPLNVAIVDGSGDQITSFGGGTQYTEDAVAAANPVGTAVNLIRQDTPAALVTTDGDNVTQRGTNYGAAYSQIVTSAGAFVDTFGGGQQYADGAVRGTATGTLAMGDDGTNIQSVKVDAAGELQVDVLTLPNVTIGAAIPAGNNNIGDVDVASVAGNVTVVQGTGTNLHAVVDSGTITTVSTVTAVTAISNALPAGTNNIGDVDVLTLPAIPAGNNNIGDVDIATIAAGDNNIGNVDIVTMPAVTNAGTFAVQVDGAALTALQLIDDTVKTLGTDTYTEATTKGLAIGAVRRDADTSAVGTDNEVAPLLVNAIGALKVEVFSGEALPVTLTSTTVTGTVAVTQSGTWDEVGINDSGNSITVDAPVGTPVFVRLSDGAAAIATLPVSLASVPSHAVTNAGTFVTQIDGAALTSLQLADDVVAVLGTDTYTEATSKGNIIAAVRRDANTSLANTTNEYAPLQVNALGGLKVGADVAVPVNVQIGNATLSAGVIDETGASAVDALAVGGGTAHDAVDSGNPVKIGGVAVSGSATPTSVATGDRTRYIANQHGIPYQMAGHPNLITREYDFGTAAQTDVNLAAAAVAADERIYVTRFEALCDNANTVNVSVRAGFGAANVPAASATGVSGMIASHPGIAAGSGIICGNGSGMLAVGAAGEEPRITSSAATTGNLHVIISYYLIDETP